MSLTKKHFEDLARKLGEENASDNLISGIADFCGAHNPLFDRTRFIQAVETNRSENRCAGCQAVIPDPNQAATQFCRDCAER